MILSGVLGLLMAFIAYGRNGSEAQSSDRRASKCDGQHANNSIQAEQLPRAAYSGVRSRTCQSHTPRRLSIAKSRPVGRGQFRQQAAGQYRSLPRSLAFPIRSLPRAATSACRDATTTRTSTSDSVYDCGALTSRPQVVAIACR